jgi:hypothetical protein
VLFSLSGSLFYIWCQLRGQSSGSDAGERLVIREFIWSEQVLSAMSDTEDVDRFRTHFEYDPINVSALPMKWLTKDTIIPVVFRGKGTPLRLMT